MANDLQQLTKLADELLNERDEIARLEQELVDTKDRVRRLQEERIPAVMDEVGMSEFVTAAGFKLKMVKKVRCGNLKNPDGLDWLRKAGHSGLIKSEVVVPFGRETDDDATSLVAELAGREIHATHNAYVAWNSLASTIKTMMEQGEDVPMETLGAEVIPTIDVRKP